MKHLEDEDIARMIEGTVSKNERETFLQHLSQCSNCFNVYTETLKFVEEEKKSRVIFRLPNLEKIKTALHGFWQKPLLAPAFATLIIILLMLPVLLLRLPDGEKIEHLAKRYEDIENRGIYTFIQQEDEVYAAVRTGIFIEDLSLLINTTGKKELRAKIVKMLESQLKVFANKKKLPELFQLGRFIEQSILETLEDKRPGSEEIKRYLRIAKEYNLPEGVIKNLQKVGSGKDIKYIKQVLEDITAVFLASQ